MKIQRRFTRTLYIIGLLLMFGGAANEAWAAKVTYHILTLPIDNSIYHMKSEVSGHRLEAVKVVVNNQTTVELPAHYKSPLAENFKYYLPGDINIGSSAIQLYENSPKTKGILYDIKAGSESNDVEEGKTIPGSTAEYYVVYTYNASNPIAQLNGSVDYNIEIKNKGYLAYNRGRNDRPAVVPTAKVNPEIISSPDFIKVNNPGAGITTYWSDNTNNKNKSDDVASQFHFIFNFKGLDPYNIMICNSYNRDITFIEKNEDGDKKFVYKWYKGGQLLSVSENNCFIVSDINKRYTTEYNSAIPNPTDPASTPMEGYLHGLDGIIWGTVALLNSTTNNDGYVFMGTRTVNSDGAVPTPGNDNKYYYLKFDNNNLTIKKQTSTEVSNNYSTAGIYPIKKLTFKVATPFYKVEQTDDHIISVSDQVSQYTAENTPIETKYLPAALKREYCNYNGKFYKNAACTQEITYFKDADYDNTEGYQVYVGYNVSASIPFKAITPAATYSAATWTGATWYELTDENSTQEYGRKLRYDGTYFKNNGAAGTYEKESEFAFIGDPYELRVVYRNATSGDTPSYVGATGTPDTGTNLTASTTASAGYKWQIADDEKSGSFLLQLYKGTGHWSWNAGHPSGNVTYHSNLAFPTGKETQTITFNVSGLNGSKYIKVTTGGTGAAQIVSVTPAAGSVVQETATTATVTVKLAENTSGADKTMTVTIQEYNDNHGDTSSGTASVITITQGTSSSAFAGNTVQYSTSSSTYVKLLELPKRNFTYNIVDKAGNIAAKATASQTIFSPLSIASIPSIIVSPFILDETITFYTTYGGGGRGNLSSPITALTAGNAESATNIYVKYTTTNLINKPAKINETQEFNVKLNGLYLYYDKTNHVIKTKASPSDSELSSPEYLWKLRNRDPYDMRIDNLGAREVLPTIGNPVAGQTETVTIYDDNGVLETPAPTRQKGAWVIIDGSLPTTSAGTGLSFTTDRDAAQHFIAKSSTATGVYEVMVATDAVDASTTYYNIGRPEENTVKIYNNATYAHGNDVLKFILNQNIDYTYYLIDKANHKLLRVSNKTPELALPAEFQSPLVRQYHFYDQDNIIQNGDEYTVRTSPTELSTPTDLEADTETNEPVASTEGAYDAADANHKHEAVSPGLIMDMAKELTTAGNHYFKVGNDYYVVNVTKACYHDIYVTYDVNDLIGFNNTGKVNDHPYLLRFLEPYAAGYYLEDGNDKLTSSKIQAIYPYCNGDGNLNIYGTAMRDEQMNGGSSTRPRWVWFFESANNDPYHVKIHSRSTISFNSVSYPTYLQTYAVHFNQSAAKVQTVVTGGMLAGIASVNPTEYMILGTEGAYKLLTTEPIAADLNGDGNTTDAGENERRFVTSFEQYWKTYNMVKLHILGVSSSTDEYSNDESTWVVPAAQRTTLNTKLEEKGIGSGNWHSYDVIANATRWNGYNDKSSGHEKKVVEKLEHWFQTFDMGNGTFNVESADIPPVLVLLDQHGWEIMRKPLPVTNYPEGDEELEALRVYDSPLVDKYYFYSNATKATGCHKYTLRLDDKGKERDQIKVNGEHYSSTSLGDLPPASASGVKSSGVLNDQFVIYTVKEEYADNYDYNLDYTETKDGDKVTGYTITSETGTSQPYFVIQNGRFYKVENEVEKPSYISKPISEHTNPAGGNIDDLIVSPTNHALINILDGSGNFIGNNFWYIKPNLRIDEEMGIKWGTEISGSEPMSQAGTQVAYKNKSGFDPYNMQLQLVNKTDGTPDGRYLTTHMTSANRINGVLVADYTGTDYYGNAGSTMVTLQPAFNSYDTSIAKGSEGYDHTNLQISNQTFMAVSDANGNMQLMPRFDHNKRLNVPKNKISNELLWSSTLEDPVDHAKATIENNNSQGPQTTFFVRPQRFIYHIIDNKGREALRYTRGGDDYPAITEHFKSPLATDFTYYKALAEAGAPAASTEQAWGAAEGGFKRTATNADMLTSLKNLLPKAGTYQYRVGTRGAFTYYSITVTKGLDEQEITGSFAAENINDVDCDIYVRYNYDEDADHEADRILEGKWFTAKLADKDLQANGTIVLEDDPETGGVEEIPGTGVNLYAGNATTLGNDNDKPTTVNASAKKWQWKFRTAPADPSSDYYELPDPYAIQLFNRQSNYTTNPSLDPSPMGVGIKVPNANTGADRFALLSHPSGGYALVVAKEYPNYDYTFLNGANMTTPSTTAATTYPENRQKLTVADATEYAASRDALTADGEYYYRYGSGSYTYKKVVVLSGVKTETNSDASEWNAGDTYHFTYKSNAISPGAQLLLEDDIVYNFTYNVITNANKLAITAEQGNAEALSHDFDPYLPASAQTPLLNMDDYLYYGFASHPGGDTYIVIQPTKLYTLYGLYDDVVYVRYDAYDMDKTNFKVPNDKGTEGGHVDRGSESNDVSMNIKGEIPYNIIWYNDNMMQSTDDTTISDGGSKSLSGTADYVWYFTGNDPYALKIKHKGGNYVNGTTSLVAEASAQDFMLLKKDGYDYGILQVTGTTGANTGKKLTGFGGALTADASTAPTKFIIFGLSVHDLIYHLVIAKTCTKEEEDDEDLDRSKYVDIPYRDGDEDDYTVSYEWQGNEKKRIFGSTQRNLTAVNEGEGTHIAGEKYQVGETISWGGADHTYSHHAGVVSIGDDLRVPNIFYRPNCTFDFYIEGIYGEDGTTADTYLNNRFKGLKLDKLMSASELIGKTVVVNIVYAFDKELATNNGLDFVRSLDQNLWYTFETQSGVTPYLAHYTNAWGLQAMAGSETHYTNDYLWTPLGDVYGFKMYNRYMNKTSGNQNNVITMDNIAENEKLYMAIPGTSKKKDSEEDVIPADYGIFELLSGDAEGYYRVHPVANNSGTRYYVKRDGSDYAVLSSTPVDWVFGLNLDLMRPYYDRAGYVGGLTAAGKTAYETALAREPFKIIDLQAVVYNDDNIIHFDPGYYRLHNQPGASGISPLRYASGYLHETEKTAVSGGIPMHFYSKEGVTTTFEGEGGLESGFTETIDTRGDIPVLATENDPSTIFYLSGNNGTRDSYGNPTSTIQTQGLYVAANANGDAANGTTTSKLQRAVMTDNSANAITFSVMDIGGAVLLIHDGAAPATRRYLNFDQTNASDKYDLKYYHESPADDAKWCLQPVQKTATAGDGEKPLTIKTNNGGDGYYYTTFYAPFDVLLPADDGSKTYHAYVCNEWHNEGVNPVPVPAHTISATNYVEGKFVPANTPVIIRVKDESGSVKLTLPTDAPSSALSSCIFTGSYLEGLQATGYKYYTLGVPFTSEVEEDASPTIEGDITAPFPEFANNGVGFYINATPNKEVNALAANWKRNNRYVLHNKIYYRVATGSSARQNDMTGIEFVPVLFDGEELPDPNFQEQVTRTYPTGVFDLQGRKVATEEEVQDGTWRQQLSPGIYIVNGKKVAVK